MDEIRITSWAELLDRLYADAWNAELTRFRSNFAFRGLPDAAYVLSTSLMRLGGPFAQLEQHLLRNFRKYAAGVNLAQSAASGGIGRDTVWTWLTLGQHFGLPTRLLDWTYSPMVAMHFATADFRRFHLDGVIWCVDFVRAHEHLPQRLRDLLQQEGSNVFTVEMLSDTVASLADFERLAPDPFVLFFEPPSLDARIVNQFALFSVLSSPAAALHEWLGGRPDLARKLVIPAGLKWEIRDKLDQANITERVLYPGLDGLSAWLKRQYSQRA